MALGKAIGEFSLKAASFTQVYRVWGPLSREKGTEKTQGTEETQQTWSG